MDNKMLDEELGKILRKIKPSWDKKVYKKIVMLNKAIKSKYPSVKLDTINQFLNEK